MVHFPGQDSCGDLLLQVLAHTDADAVVLHGGDMPYLVRESGNQALARQTLTADAVAHVARELLPADTWRSLGELGAAEHDCRPAGSPGSLFKVVAGHFDDDLWLEIRRVPCDEDVLSLPASDELWRN
jgi:hypothetical protein